MGVLSILLMLLQTMRLETLRLVRPAPPTCEGQVPLALA